MGFQSRRPGYKGLMQCIHLHKKKRFTKIFVDAKEKEREDKRRGELRKSSKIFVVFLKNISTFTIESSEVSL